jgi:hypothetical protein
VKRKVSVGNHPTAPSAYRHTLKRILQGRRKKDNYPEIGLDCFIDGVLVDEHILDDDYLLRPSGARFTTYGKEVKPGEKRKYRFALPVRVGSA